jgi:ubiquinone/menaquinone biosynthesis C-methylase UbiE
MGYLEVPFFNIGGIGSIDRLAKLLDLKDGDRVLEVGCGTGANACYLANKYGCVITGIDISEQMVKEAQIRAEELGVDRVSFQLGDAYDLDFPDESFDVVLTIFVSQFLDTSKAYPEFSRVLVHGGRLGINEMYKESEIPEKIRARVDEGEQVFKEMTELPFSKRSDTEWMQSFTEAGITDIKIHKFTNVARSGSALKMVDEIDGWWKIINTIWEMLVIAAKSKKIRQRIMLIGKGKGILVNDPVNSKYIGYILCVGYKP